MSSASDFVIENGVLKEYKGPGGDVAIPDGVTEIGRCAFFRCGSLKHLTIPNSVTSIGEFAFSGCERLISTPPRPTGRGEGLSLLPPRSQAPCKARLPPGPVGPGSHPTFPSQ